MPYVRMAALSGSIAHLNLEGGGDLDLFIVTRGRRVWSVTVAALLLAKLLRQRRVMCVNFVIADVRLDLDQEDLFTASQIIHLKPLVGADLYRRFVQANPFVVRYYPNFHASVPRPSKSAAVLERAKRLVEVVLTPISAPLETVCRSAYGWYLRRSAGSWRSPDQVRLQDDCLKLHTQSHRRSILERFDLTMRETIGRV
jgi:hypothetical protein